MALTISLESIGPGRGRLLVSGSRPAPESTSLAIQRNDGRYLAPGQLWQVTSHWHPQFSVEPMADGIRLELGPDLVDGIIGVGGAPLRVALRIDGVEDAAVLRIRGELVGSGATAPERSAFDSGDTLIMPRKSVPVPAAEDVSDLATKGPSAPAADTPGSNRRPLWPWIAVAIVLVLVAAGVGVWQFGLLGPDAPDESAEAVPDTEIDPEPVPDEVPPADAEPEPEPKQEPEQTGLLLARKFLAGNPAAEAVFARAVQAEQAGDCPAAYALYSDAANKDPGLAARLARRYDPLTHTAGPCIAAPDAPYAIVYYADAAEKGDVAVQRRLGQLMVERETSGPTREAGVAWLRKAAEAETRRRRGYSMGLAVGEPLGCVRPAWACTYGVKVPCRSTCVHGVDCNYWNNRESPGPVLALLHVRGRGRGKGRPGLHARVPGTVYSIH